MTEIRGVDPSLLDAKKIEIPEERREIIEMELQAIKDIITSVENNEENYAYADTSSSMETIDDLLGSDAYYQSQLAGRKEASRKIMRGNENEKQAGLVEIRKWIETIKAGIAK